MHEVEDRNGKKTSDEFFEHLLSSVTCRPSSGFPLPFSTSDIRHPTSGFLSAAQQLSSLAACMRCMLIGCLFLLIVNLVVPAGSAGASDRPFIGAANWGGTGLYEIPNARILEDGVFRLGYGRADPFGWYTVGMGVLPWLEISGRYTEIEDRPTNLGDGAFGDYKDKAVDLKFQLLGESGSFPALAAGIHDAQGTRLFPAEYLVASKRLGPLDFTLGVGTGRLGGGATEAGDRALAVLSKEGLKSAGPFGGIEWGVHERVNLMVEYNPVDYEKDPRLGTTKEQPVPEGADWSVNIGARIEVFDGFEVGVSWQRGDTLGVSAHFNLMLGKSILPKQPDPPVWKTIEAPPFSEENAGARMEAILEEIHQIGFTRAAVFTDGRFLTAEFENTKYLSNEKAAGRVLRVLLAHAPAGIERIEAVIAKRRMPMSRISIRPGHFDDYLLGKMRPDIFAELIKMETVSSGYLDGRRIMAAAGNNRMLDFDWGIKPEVDTYLNDPSGVFQYRVGIKPWAQAQLWKGSALQASYMIPFVSNVESSNIPPPDAVRSDSWKYLGDESSLSSLVYDQTLRLSDRVFGRVTTGYLEPMYAGVGGELLAFPGKGNIAFGVESDWARKRIPGTAVELDDDEDYYTILGNAYFRFAPFDIDMTLRAQYGRFLGGDTGWRFEAKRSYPDTGLEIGAWYSITDTDHFLADFNRGYNDKGVFIRLPARMFTLRETSVMYNYSFKPWSRDVAATVYHWNPLFEFGSDLMPGVLEKNVRQVEK